MLTIQPVSIYNKINMLLDTYAPLTRIHKYKLKFKSLTLDNVRFKKINICKKQITYKFY